MPTPVPFAVPMRESPIPPTIRWIARCLYTQRQKSKELFAHVYSKLYNILSTGLRFFTVHGPAGWPDMACFVFANKLRDGKATQILNGGNRKWGLYLSRARTSRRACADLRSGIGYFT